MSGELTLEGPRFELAGEELRALSGGALADLRGDAPARLYGLGDPAALEAEAVAVIGARNATPYGTSCARLAARACVRMGLGVVSGAALGCDQAAQLEALERGGRVVAVLGCGADVVYPRRSAGLLDRVVRDGGAVVSERPWGSPPERWSFVRRNRIIAALSGMLVVCEAGRHSGTFSTAQAAQDMGRDVVVFPGSFFSPNSWGSNFLVQNGAQCLCDEDDLEVALSRAFGRLRSPGEPMRRDPTDVFGLGAGERGALAALTACPAQPGALATGLGLSPVVMMRILGSLEARGLVERLVDGRYSPSQAALARASGPSRAAAGG